MRHIGIPYGTAPRQADLDRAFEAANGAILRWEGDDRGELDARELAALRDATRIVEGSPRVEQLDPGDRYEVQLARDGLDVGVVVIRPDLSVRWAGWERAAPAADPRALGEQLAARGLPGPLAALARRTSPEGEAAAAAFLSAAPRAISVALESLAREPGASGAAEQRRAFEALVAATGSAEQAVFQLLAWLGSRRGAWSEGPEVEGVADGLLHEHGLDEVIALLARGVPAEARAGAARFLVDNIRSRGRAVREQLPEAVRAALVEAASRTGSAENEARTRRLLIDEGPLAPEGTELVAAARGGRLGRACADASGVAAIDAGRIVWFSRAAARLADRGSEEAWRTLPRAELARVMRPDTPLAVRDGHVWFVHTSGPRSVSIATGEDRDRHGAWFGLPARRLARDVPRYHRAREEALAHVLPAGAPRLALGIDRDERDAYEAFGGDLPSALRSPFFWACDVPGRRLVRVSSRRPTRETPLDGAPVRIGAQGDRVHVLTSHEDGSVSVVVAGGGDELRRSARCAVRAEDVRRVLLVGDEIWLRVRAPLGDVLVALAG